MKLITANRNYSSWSLRPWVLMKALGIPFEEQRVSFRGLDNHDEFRAFSPNGCVPALVDGDRVIWDSLGIVLYLADRHPEVWPAQEEARAWAQCAVAEMHSGFSHLRGECTMNVGVRVARKTDSPGLLRDLHRVAELFDQGIARFGGPYLAGPAFSAVDAFFAPVAFRVRTYDLPLGASGKAWVGRMLDLSAMREWESDALAETYREEGHEAELAATGSITADYRAGAA